MQEFLEKSGLIVLVAFHRKKENFFKDNELLALQRCYE